MVGVIVGVKKGVTVLVGVGVGVRKSQMYSNTMLKLSQVPEDTVGVNVNPGVTVGVLVKVCVGVGVNPEVSVGV